MQKVKNYSKISLEYLFMLKIILGYVAVMSEYVSRRMNVYIGFALLVLCYIVLWNCDMIRRWDTYSTFEVYNSILTNIPLVAGALLTILSYKVRELFRFRFLIVASFTFYCFINGLYFGFIDITSGWSYSSPSIQYLGLLTDLFTFAGGFFLFNTLLDDRDHKKL
jgi:hypothetical protein